jgi:hypothetical protein
MLTLEPPPETMPPPNNPRVLEEQPARDWVAVVRSPKSVALPTVAIVTYSIVLNLLPALKPPPNKPRVLEEQEANPKAAVVISPKSEASPSVEILI